MKRLLIITILLFLTINVTADVSNRKESELQGVSNISMYVKTNKGIPQYIAGDLSRCENGVTEFATTMDFFNKNKSVYRFDDFQRILL